MAKQIRRYEFIYDSETEGNILERFTSNAENFRELKIPASGDICQLAIVQTSGTNSGFEAELYAADVSAMDADEREAYRLVNKIDIEASDATFSLNQVSIPYSTVATNAVHHQSRSPYLMVKPLTDAGTKTFLVTMTVILDA